MRFLLFPFAILYGVAVRLRHFLYDKGWLLSKRYPFPTLCVGNLAVGGTGKTPMVEYLIRLLGQEQIAVLSRGYRRKTKGFVLADTSATALTLGDEPFQYHRKFPQTTIAVCESRQEGIERLLEHPHFQVILLDDAFQHRKVQAGLNLLLTSYSQLYSNDFLSALTYPKKHNKKSYNSYNLLLISKFSLPVLPMRRRFVEKEKANLWRILSLCPLPL